MNSALLGIDLGTSGAKAGVFSPDGTLLGSGRASYEIHFPHRGWAEQSVDDWWTAVVDSVRQAVKEAGNRHIESIGVCGQMQGLVCLDKDYRPLRPAIVWADQRSREQAERINTYLDEQCLYNLTLGRAFSGFQFPSFLWVYENETEIARNTAHILLPKDYIRFRLTGEIATEPSDACSTAAFDVVRQRWLEELFLHFSIGRKLFPQPLKSTDCAGELKKDAAEALGLSPGIPIAAGAGDQAAQAVGNGLISPGDSSSNIGTAGQFFVASGETFRDPTMCCNCFNHAQPGIWYLLGANLSAGFALKWLWQSILRKEDYAEADYLASTAPPGSRGLIFHPYLNGDRTPNDTWEASASFIGFSGRHGTPEMVRAVMEGVVFSLREGLEVARLMDMAPSKVIASGGGARSALWRQIQADVYNLPVGLSETREQACAGAAILGGVAAGRFSSIAAGCTEMVRHSPEITEPIPENVALYEEIYQTVYRSFYSNNRDLYHKLFRWRKNN